MIKLLLTEDQAWTIINALHTAADSYGCYARQCGHLRIVQQFEKQAEQARDYASMIANAPEQGD